MPASPAPRIFLRQVALRSDLGERIPKCVAARLLCEDLMGGIAAELASHCRGGAGERVRADRAERSKGRRPAGRSALVDPIVLRSPRRSLLRARHVHLPASGRPRRTLRLRRLPRRVLLLRNVFAKLPAGSPCESYDACSGDLQCGVDNICAVSKITDGDVCEGDVD
jgi:hypothetical protein